MAQQQKISVYNLADLKNTSNDALPNYLNSLKFTQSHTLMDVRLALGYSAFAVAAACFAWDHKLGFEATKYWTMAAVAVYMLLNGALTLWIWLMEGGTVYVGTAPSGEKIQVATSTTKNEPVYHMTITLTPKTGNGAPSTVKLSRSFTEWFDGQGTFIATPFQTMLATNVSLIGKFDTKNAKSAKSAKSESLGVADMTPEMLDAVMAASASGAETTGSVSKKGGKRRKA